MSRMVSFVCPGCGKEAHKPTGAFNRATKGGRPIYCGRACFAAAKTFLTPELKRKRAAEYRQVNRARLLERGRARRTGQEREKILAAQLDYHYRNREKCLANSRAYHAANKEKRADAHRRWREENRDKADLNNARAVLAESMHVARSEVPTDLAEVKVELWKLQRELRAIAAGTQSAETNEKRDAV